MSQPVSEMKKYPKPLIGAVSALLRARSLDKVELRSCEKIGWQAEAPAPPKRKRLRINVGQTLSSVNLEMLPIFSRLLTVAAPIRAARVSERFPDTLVNF